eukprot:11018198-Karenia_brevis.AAC.1
MPVLLTLRDTCPDLLLSYLLTGLPVPRVPALMSQWDASPEDACPPDSTGYLSRAFLTYLS